MPEISPNPQAPDLQERKIIRLTDTPADPARNWVRAAHFSLMVGNAHAGKIALRLGTTPFLEFYGGHIGYTVEPAFRGHGLAAWGVRHILPVAENEGLTPLWITCNPDNWASRRTAETVGARLVAIVDLPEDCEMYARGDRRKCRYRLDLPSVQAESLSKGLI